MNALTLGPGVDRARHALDELDRRERARSISGAISTIGRRSGLMTCSGPASRGGVIAWRGAGLRRVGRGVGASRSAVGRSRQRLEQRLQLGQAARVPASALAAASQASMCA